MRQHTFENPRLRCAIRLALTGGTLAASFGTAYAQTAPATAATAAPNDQLQEVVVTGSRISVPNQASISPVTFVSALDIQQTGVTRVEDLLNELPQVFAAQGSNISNASTGTATVNLRGLNDKRTLVLVDGFRLGPGDPASSAASDINMIPVEMIDSVEVLTGGASSVYGADAVAGVVNFKLNDHFEGVKLVADAGLYQHSNNDPDGVQQAIAASGFQQAPSSVNTGAQKSLAFIAGLNSPDGNGNATFYATYRNIGAVLQSKYDYSACTLGSGFVAGPSNTNGKFYCAGSSTSYPGRFTVENINGVPVTGGVENTIGPGGSLIPYTSANDYNFGALNYYQRPDERYTAGAFLHYEFNDHATVYSQFMFMDDRSTAQIAPGGIFVGEFSFNCSNPLLSGQEVSTWCGGNTANTTTLLIGRRDVEGGPRLNDLEHTDFHEVIGIKGKLDDAWAYDGSFQYSMVNLNSVVENFFDETKITNSLNVTGTAAAPVCTVGPPCVPYNIFSLGGVTQAAINYLDTPAQSRGQVTQTVADVNFTGDLGKYGIQSPVASSGLKVNIGGEYRDVKSFTQPDEESQTGDLSGTGGALLPVSGGIISREGFVEARMPLIEDKPFAQSLDVESGYRYSSYDLGFNTNTYKFGVDWSPVHDVRLRGSFARAVRAPNVVELFSPSAVALDGSYDSDPCAGAHPAASAAACARTGVTAAEYGNVQSNPANQYNGLQGGNSALKPETALTTSFGIGWTPSFVPGFRVQIDYYNIKIEDTIQTVGAGTVLTQCLTNDLLCNDIHRDALGSLWILPSGYVTDNLVNIGTLLERGVDVDLSYAFDLGSLGKIHTALVGTYINEYQVTPIAGNPASAYNCVGLYGATCSSFLTGAGIPVFRWRNTLRTTWSTPWSGLDVSLAWRYFSPVKTEQLSGNPNLTAGAGATIANGGISNTDAYLSSYSYFDLTAAVKLGDKMSLRLGVNNIFDKNPPIIGASTLPGPPAGNGNTFPQVYDSLGRFIFGEFIAQF
jgi:iron complex outermembrane recepter protein